MNYFTYFKRLVKFEKYPLFRTVPFKYLLLNILIIGILLSIPNMLSFVNTNQFASTLDEVKDDIPKFEIVNYEYSGNEATLDSSKGKIIFTNDEVNTKDAFISFQKQGIEVQNMTEDYLSYSSFDKFKNDQELKNYIDTHKNSASFFFVVYSIIQIIVMSAFVFTILLLLSFILNKFAEIKNKRTDYMNWFKIISYSFVIPSVIFAVIEFVTHREFWWVYLFVIIFLTYYYKKLPEFKKKRKPSI